MSKPTLIICEYNPLIFIKRVCFNLHITFALRQTRKKSPESDNFISSCFYGTYTRSKIHHCLNNKMSITWADCCCWMEALGWVFSVAAQELASAAAFPGVPEIVHRSSETIN